MYYLITSKLEGWWATKHERAALEPVAAGIKRVCNVFAMSMIFNPSYNIATDQFRLKY